MSLEQLQDEKEGVAGWTSFLKYSIKSSCITSIALTKLDVLSEIDELKVCTAYQYEGKKIETAYPGIDLEKVEPVFETFTPFKDQFDGSPLSDELNRYIQLIEETTQVQVGIIAFGRSEIRYNLEKNFSKIHI